MSSRQDQTKAAERKLHGVEGLRAHHGFVCMRGEAVRLTVEAINLESACRRIE